MVSVVIPTHNRADLIERAVKSVLNQTYKEFEIIIVSDGSTDNTDEVVERLKNVDGRIRYISYSPGKGGNAARNTGIKEANYEYIAFLDDDDEWLPDKLEKQVEVLENDSRIGLVCTGVNIIYVDECISYESRPKVRGDLSKKILIKNYIGTTSTVLVKKKVLSKAGVFDIDLKARQDYDLWIRIAQHTNVGVVSEPCVNYYNNLGNNQISHQTQKYEEATDYIRDKYKDLYNNLDLEASNQYYINSYLELVNRGMRNNDKKTAKKYAKLAMKKKLNIKTIGFFIMTRLNYRIVLYLRKKYRL